MNSQNKSTDLKRATDKALNYLATRIHSKKELYTKLYRNFTDEVCAQVINDMERIGYLNDEEYADTRIKHLISKQKSIAEIKADLHAKGIDRDIAYEKLQNIEDYNEKNACIALITKKYMSKIIANDTQKVLLALMRRGYSYDSAKEALRHVLCETENE